MSSILLYIVTERTFYKRMSMISPEQWTEQSVKDKWRVFRGVVYCSVALLLLISLLLYLTKWYSIASFDVFDISQTAHLTLRQFNSTIVLLQYTVLQYSTSNLIIQTLISFSIEKLNIYTVVVENLMWQKFELEVTLKLRMREDIAIFNIFYYTPTLCSSYYIYDLLKHMVLVFMCSDLADNNQCKINCLNRTQ